MGIGFPPPGARAAQCKPQFAFGEKLDVPILLVDDGSAYLRARQAVPAGPGIEFVGAASGGHRRTRFALILLAFCKA